MCNHVQDHAVQDMRTSLSDMSKHEFLLEALPDFTQRPWLETLPRGSRIYVARYMLSQHRMPIEVGRWCKLDRTERTCTWCRTMDSRCGIICQCEPPQAWVCRNGMALPVILPMYEVLLYDDGGQNTTENWDRRRRTGGLTYESKGQDIWTACCDWKTMV